MNVTRADKNVCAGCNGNPTTISVLATVRESDVHQYAPYDQQWSDLEIRHRSHR
jgi:hypothetical protein